MRPSDKDIASSGPPVQPARNKKLILAAAGLANVGACISSHPHTSSAVVLLWHGATVTALTAAGAWAGPQFFSWQRLRHLSR